MEFKFSSAALVLKDHLTLLQGILLDPLQVSFDQRSVYHWFREQRQNAFLMLCDFSKLSNAISFYFLWLALCTTQTYCRQTSWTHTGTVFTRISYKNSWTLHCMVSIFSIPLEMLICRKNPISWTDIRFFCQQRNLVITHCNIFGNNFIAANKSMLCLLHLAPI